MRFSILLVLSGGALYGQFRDLSTYGDGTDLYYAVEVNPRAFDINYLSRGAPIYKLGSVPATLSISFPQPIFPPDQHFGNFSYISTYYLASHPQFSRDGSVFAFTRKRVCLGGEVCEGYIEFQTTVQGLPGTAPLTFNGMGWLSGNGRYLLADPIQHDVPQATLTDLQTGQQYHLGVTGAVIFSESPLSYEPTYSTSGRVVADDGTAVGARASGSVFLVRGGQIQQGVSFAFAGAEPVIDAEAQVVVYSTLKSPRALHSYRIATSSDSLFLQANGDTYSPAVTSDGKRVFFLSTAQFGTSNPPGLPQLYSINIDHTGFEELTSFIEPSGVQKYTITDDGNVVWYVSGDGNLVKLNLRGVNPVQTVFHAAAADLSSTLVPGSATTINGAALSDGAYAADTQKPLPTELAGVQILLAGNPAPLISVTPTQILFQVPWETVPGQTISMQLMTKAHTSAEATVTALVTPVASSPRLCTTLYCSNDIGGNAIHQDWRGPVTFNDPALPGEIVYFYGTGFGPVQPTASTGASAPADSLSIATTPLECNAKVLFAGLAPGATGYYQLAVQLPDIIHQISPAKLFGLTCGDNLLAVVPAQTTF